MSKKNLIKCTASAGAGKTEALSKEFAEILLKEFSERGSDAYKRILAVTFTNAATAEMKERIIRKLYEISKEEDPERSKKATSLITSIVNDYSMFRVSTIDTFFQSVLRSFALEFGSRSSYMLTLEEEPVVTAAIDSLYENLGNDSELRKALLKLYLDQMDQEKSWNFKKTLYTTGKEVTKEQYNSRIISPEKEKMVADFVRKWENELEESFVKPIGETLAEIGKVAGGYPYQSDWFSGGKTKSLIFKLLQNYAIAPDVVNSNEDPIAVKVIDKAVEVRGAAAKKFIDDEKAARMGKKVKSGTLIPSSDEYDKAPPKSAKSQIKAIKATIEELCSKINPLTEKIRELYDKYSDQYFTVQAISKNLGITLLFSRIRGAMEEYCKKEQLSLLSDAPGILKDIIAGSDTPFIYERIGSAIDHFLLDEFQDTNRRQWENFLPLLHESLSRNKENFVVGDVKQSIYSFRGAVWDILNSEIDREFANDIVDDPKQVNYRSLRNVVHFNNAFFSSKVSGSGTLLLKDAVAGELKNLSVKNEQGEEHLQQIESIYADARQEVRPEYQSNKEGGAVVLITNVGGVSSEEGESDGAKSKKSNKKDIGKFFLEDMLDRINYLTSDAVGYHKKDIMVLTSKNQQASEVANFLTSHGVRIVSTESLLLSDSAAVALLIAILRLENDPDCMSVEILSKLGQTGITQETLLEGLAEIKQQGFNTLYEFCNAIIASAKCFPQELREDTAYIDVFMDKILEYTMLNGSDLNAFLRWWDEASEKFTIPSPSDDDAVRIMTMHKAKGLASKVVFIPYLREEIIKIKAEQIWLTADNLGTPHELQGVKFLLDRKKDLKATLFSDSYDREKIDNAIDTFNLTYVSFTRAREKLFVYVQSKANDTSNISDLLKIFADRSNGSPLDGSDTVLIKQEPSTIEDEKGRSITLCSYTFGDETEHALPIEEQRESNPISLGRYELCDSVKGKLRTPSFIGEGSARQIGLLYHDLYSEIGTFSPDTMHAVIDGAVSKFMASHPSYTEIAGDKESIVGIVEEQINSVKKYGWYSSEYKYLMERDILVGEHIYRPDRVLIDEKSNSAIVVDYKFGEFDPDAPSHSKYLRQVRGYKRCLKEMGFSSVKGYLWYALAGSVVKVE